jgi:N-acetylglucosaminyldiphosphoundecaprenol N-acetyl-beta-D-mannosaminyltransferase
VEFSFADHTIAVNMATWAGLRAEIRRRLRAGEGFALATLNLDHLVKLAASADFARAYAGQDLVVADGRPIVGLSRLAGRPVDLLPGSDLIVPLCKLAAAAAAPVALVGSTDPALRDAAKALAALVPDLDIALCIAPSGGFDPDGNEAGEILQRLRATGVRLCFLALGAPKQEMLALRGRELAPDVGFASIGAGLDFLGGHQRRAPLWMRRLALEWLWRALSSPIRLGPRYARGLAVLPRHLVQAWRLRRRVR